MPSGNQSALTWQLRVIVVPKVRVRHPRELIGTIRGLFRT
jgi:hypothetical protein